MKVPDEFGPRLTAIAESTPRNAIENLLMGLMPRVPVTARVIRTDDGGRAMVPPDVKYDGTVDEAPQPGPFRKLMRAPRTRAPHGRDYEVLVPYADSLHRFGTWRHAMASAVVNAEVTNTLAVSRAFAAKWEGHKFAQQGIDFNWLAKVGYISF